MLNTKGAALKLGCSITWIRKLVEDSKLTTYIYNDQGTMEQYQPGQPHQGQGMYFLEDDLADYRPKASRRPMGARDKVEDNPKRRKKTQQVAEAIDAK